MRHTGWIVFEHIAREITGGRAHFVLRCELERGAYNLRGAPLPRAAHGAATDRRWTDSDDEDQDDDLSGKCRGERY